MESALRPRGSSSTRATISSAKAFVRSFRLNCGTSRPRDFAFRISNFALQVALPHIRPHFPELQGSLFCKIGLNYGNHFIDLVTVRPRIERASQMRVQLSRRVLYGDRSQRTQLPPLRVQPRPSQYFPVGVDHHERLD